MKLMKVRVRNFRNILDSGEVDIQPDVTCLVGKNESGKTAFLQALHRLNPAHANVSLSIPDQYPAWLEKRHRKKGDLNTFCPVEAEFRVEDADMASLEKRFGKGVLKSDIVKFGRQYDGKPLIRYGVDENVELTEILKGVTLPAGNRPADRKALDALLAQLKEKGDKPEAIEAASNLQNALALKASEFEQSLRDAVSELIPKFFYYADYSRLPGTVKIRELLKADRTKLDDNEVTAIALLELAGADDDYLLNPDYERRKRELENVANALSQEILEYWTTNTDIRVDIDITQQKIPAADGGQTTVTDELKIRLWDDRHFLSLPFDERSSGFRWFFSFLAAFSPYRDDDDKKVIILLDEPALGLHARAQKDFLRYVDQALSQTHQVIYTTHSPFMVQPDHLERVRLVEDRGRDFGSTVSADVLASERDTLFPLQGALGYDLAQHLFVAPHNLVVEGASDFTYLTIMSRHLVSLGRTGLSDQWSIVPVGGADMVPTFVALLGHHLEVTVLVDSQKAGHQRLERMANQGLLQRNRIIMIGNIVDQKFADIEDLFAVDDYLKLYNAAFGAKLKASRLNGTDAIRARIERQTGSTFDHGAPADLLLRRRDQFLTGVSEETLNRFEKLFGVINETLPERSS
jgi:energy-coupling factor transporter ATP-binding protein EcfA2